MFHFNKWVPSSDLNREFSIVLHGGSPPYRKVSHAWPAMHQRMDLYHRWCVSSPCHLKNVVRWRFPHESSHLFSHHPGTWNKPIFHQKLELGNFSSSESVNLELEMLKGEDFVDNVFTLLLRWLQKWLGISQKLAISFSTFLLGEIPHTLCFFFKTIGIEESDVSE